MTLENTRPTSARHSRAHVLAAAWVLPVASPPIADGVVVVEGERIAWVGRRVELPDVYRTARVRAYPQALLLPGFVNAHCHLYLTAMFGRLRGRADRFTDWLRDLVGELGTWPPETAVRSTSAGLSLLRTRGVTCVGEMARAPAIEAFVASPLRATLFLEVISFPAARAGEALDAARAWLDSFEERWRGDVRGGMQDAGCWTQDTGAGITSAAHPASCIQHPASSIQHPGSRLSVGIAPHAPYTVSAPLARGLAELARDRRLPVAIHLAETEVEREFLATGGGGFESLLRERGAWDESWRPPEVSPVRWAADLGLLELPGAAVHVNYLSDADIELLKAGRMVPVWCPGSHRWFGHGDHPAERLIAAGVPVVLGTDSLASNNSLDMLAEIRLAAETFPNVAPETWLRAATVTAAGALGLGNEIGSLEAGKAADVIALECETGVPAEPLRALLEDPVRLRMAMVAGEEVSIRDGVSDA